MIAYFYRTLLFDSLIDMVTTTNQEPQQNIDVNMVRGRWTLHEVDASAYPYRVVHHLLGIPAPRFPVQRHDDFLELYGRD